jgi:Mor family transcriptional regulator
MNPIESQLILLDRLAAPFAFDESAADASDSLYGQVAQLIGWAAADKLIEHFGGRRLYIPRTASRRNQIRRSIGARLAAAMAREFGSERILIPATCDRARRRARIFAMRANGISVSRIARELHCTERYVYKVLAASRPSQIAEALQPSAKIAERFKRGRFNHRL